MRDIVRIEIKGNPGVRSYCYQRSLGDVMVRAVRLRSFLTKWHGQDRWMQVLNYKPPA